MAICLAGWLQYGFPKTRSSIGYVAPVAVLIKLFSFGKPLETTDKALLQVP